LSGQIPRRIESAPDFGGREESIFHFLKIKKEESPAASAEIPAQLTEIGQAERCRCREDLERVEFAVCIYLILTGCL
jgi:hypothetical protein